MSFGVHPEAQAEDEVRYYERRSPGLGNRFGDEVLAVFATVSATPRMDGRATPAARGREVRPAPLPSFPFLVVYDVRGPDVLVVAVAHASRRPGYWRRRLP